MSESLKPVPLTDIFDRFPRPAYPAISESVEKASVFGLIRRLSNPVEAEILGDSFGGTATMTEMELARVTELLKQVPADRELTELGRAKKSERLRVAAREKIEKWWFELIDEVDRMIAAAQPKLSSGEVSALADDATRISRRIADEARAGEVRGTLRRIEDQSKRLELVLGALEQRDGFVLRALENDPGRKLDPILPEDAIAECRVRFTEWSSPDLAIRRQALATIRGHCTFNVAKAFAALGVDPRVTSDALRARDADKAA
jgi:hypothetical protein